MASVHRELVLDAPPEAVWAAVRDVGAVHERLFPGYLTDARLEGPEDGRGSGGDVPTRVVTFASGLVVREHVVAVDDEHRRVAWTAVGGRAAHHHASMQVRPERTASGMAGSRLVWSTDVLPDVLEPAVRALVDGGAAVLTKTFAAPSR